MLMKYEKYIIYKLHIELNFSLPNDNEKRINT